MSNKPNINKEYEYNYQLDVEDIEYLICHVSMLWRRLLNSKIKHLNISATEKRVLICIGRNPGLTQVQIANLLELEPQNLIRSLDKLEQQEWIAKQADANDRRSKCLFITDKAKKIISQVKEINESVKPQILTGMDKKQIEQLIQALTHVRENLFEELGIRR